MFTPNSLDIHGAHARTTRNDFPVELSPATSDLVFLGLMGFETGLFDCFGIPSLLACNRKQKRNARAVLMCIACKFLWSNGLSPMLQAAQVGARPGNPGFSEIGHSHRYDIKWRSGNAESANHVWISCMWSSG